MARHRRRVITRVKLGLEAGRATPALPVGRDLGPQGVNLAEFCRRDEDPLAKRQRFRPTDLLRCSRKGPRGICAGLPRHEDGAGEPDRGQRRPLF
jgi:hypothetical protein